MRTNFLVRESADRSDDLVCRHIGGCSIIKIRLGVKYDVEPGPPSAIVPLRDRVARKRSEIGTEKEGSEGGEDDRQR